MDLSSTTGCHAQLKLGDVSAPSRMLSAQGPPGLEQQQLADLLNWENLQVPLWWLGCLTFPRFIFIPDAPWPGCRRNPAHLVSSNSCLCAQEWGWAGPCPVEDHGGSNDGSCKNLPGSKLKHLGHEAVLCSHMERACFFRCFPQRVRGENTSGKREGNVVPTEYRQSWSEGEHICSSVPVPISYHLCGIPVQAASKHQNWFLPSARGPALSIAQFHLTSYATGP